MFKNGEIFINGKYRGSRKIYFDYFFAFTGSGSCNISQTSARHILDIFFILSSVADPECRVEKSRMRIRIEEFKYRMFNPKTCYGTGTKLSEILFDLGCSSRILDPDFFPIPYPGVKKAPDPGSGSATLIVHI